MTTFATLSEAERALDARTQAAWAAYGDELRGLPRSAYDAAEPAAWDRLQATLIDVEGLRTSLAMGASGA